MQAVPLTSYFDFQRGSLYWSGRRGWRSGWWACWPALTWLPASWSGGSSTLPTIPPTSKVSKQVAKALFEFNFVNCLMPATSLQHLLGSILNETASLDPSDASCIQQLIAAMRENTNWNKPLCRLFGWLTTLIV